MKFEQMPKKNKLPASVSHDPRGLTQGKKEEEKSWAVDRVSPPPPSTLPSATVRRNASR